MSNLVKPSFPCPHRAKFCHLCPASRRMPFIWTSSGSPETSVSRTSWPSPSLTSPALNQLAASMLAQNLRSSLSRTSPRTTAMFAISTVGRKMAVCQWSTTWVSQRSSWHPLALQAQTRMLALSRMQKSRYQCCDSLLLCWVPQLMILWLASVVVHWMTRPCSPAHCVCWKVALATWPSASFLPAAAMAWCARWNARSLWRRQRRPCTSLDWWSACECIAQASHPRRAVQHCIAVLRRLAVQCIPSADTPWSVPINACLTSTLLRWQQRICPCHRKPWSRPQCCDSLLLCWVPQLMILWLASVVVLWMTRPCSPAHCVCWKVALATWPSASFLPAAAMAWCARWNARSLWRRQRRPCTSLDWWSACECIAQASHPRRAVQHCIAVLRRLAVQCIPSADTPWSVRTNACLTSTLLHWQQRICPCHRKPWSRPQCCDSLLLCWVPQLMILWLASVVVHWMTRPCSPAHCVCWKVALAAWPSASFLPAAAMAWCARWNARSLWRRQRRPCTSLDWWSACECIAQASHPRRAVQHCIAVLRRLAVQCIPSADTPWSVRTNACLTSTLLHWQQRICPCHRKPWSRPQCCDSLLLCWVPQLMILWLASVVVLWMTRPCSPAHCVCWKVALAAWPSASFLPAAAMAWCARWNARSLWRRQRRPCTSLDWWSACECIAQASHPRRAVQHCIAVLRRLAVQCISSADTPWSVRTNACLTSTPVALTATDLPMPQEAVVWSPGPPPAHSLYILHWFQTGKGQSGNVLQEKKCTSIGA